jgi:hypothetical protein
MPERVLAYSLSLFLNMNNFHTHTEWNRTKLSNHALLAICHSPILRRDFDHKTGAMG